MKKYFFIISYILLSVSARAQVKDATIKIKKAKWDVRVRPADSILWIDKENHVEINVEGGSNYLVNVKDGKIKHRGNKYTLNVFTEGAEMLTVSEKLPNKKGKTIFTKLYQVKRIPDPVAFVCGVKSDSVIEKQQIINDNKVTAIHPFYKMELAVLGFDVIFTFGGKIDTLTSTNSHFTIDMRRRIYYLTSGSILYFENIYCAMPDGRIQKIKPFEIFVTETNKFKVGYRVKGL